MVMRRREKRSNAALLEVGSMMRRREIARIASFLGGGEKTESLDQEAHEAEVEVWRGGLGLERGL
jgi:hypothetical protein